MALLLSGIGIIKLMPRLVYIGAILVFPITLYVAGAPRFGYPVLLLPFLYLGAAVAVSKKRKWLAGGLLLPFTLLFGYLGYVALFH